MARHKKSDASELDTPMPSMEPPTPLPDDEDDTDSFERSPLSIAGEPHLERWVVRRWRWGEFTIHATLVYPSGARLPFATQEQWERHLAREQENDRL